VNQGGTADKLGYSSLTDRIYLSRTFFMRVGKVSMRKGVTIIARSRRCVYVINQTMATPKRVPESE